MLKGKLYLSSIRQKGRAALSFTIVVFNSNIIEMHVDTFIYLSFNIIIYTSVKIHDWRRSLHQTVDCGKKRKAPGLPWN